MYADVEKHVRNCADCETGKGAPRNPGPSPGNILVTYPFLAASMSFVLPLAPSSRDNTVLLLFQYMPSGYCMCKPTSSTTAQNVAEAYEEMMFRRFGASSIIRHDRDPRFMSEVFNCFREMMGSRQRATLAYRPQANSQQERSVQTVVNSIRAYIAAPNQDNWDEIVEKLMWALNTSFDATRRETPFFLVHRWDAKTTAAALMTKPPSPVDQLSAYLWRIKAQRQYEYAVSWARKLQSKAKQRRAEA